MGQRLEPWRLERKVEISVPELAKEEAAEDDFPREDHQEGTPRACLENTDGSEHVGLGVHRAIRSWRATDSPSLITRCSARNASMTF